MKQFFNLLLLASLSTIFPLRFASAILYGEDHRLERYELGTEEGITYSESTAALINSTRVKKNSTGYEIDFSVRGNGRLPDGGACKRAFVGQPQLTSFCSATLVGRDLLLTAGHCFNHSNKSAKEICDETLAVFDYAYEKKDSTATEFAAKNVYQCKRVESVSFGEGSGDDWDYALFRLDREVPKRKVYSLRTKRSKNKLLPNTVLTTSGYPHGLPNKTVAGIFVRNSQSPLFSVLYMDMMDGSSGSSVIDFRKKELIGILVASGCGDMTWDQQKECFTEEVFHGQCEGSILMRSEKIFERVFPFLD